MVPFMSLIKLFPAVIITTFIFTACSSSSEKEGCNQYRTGKFRYHVKGKNKGNYFVIEREETTQKETNEKTHVTSTASIKWTGDCTYELQYLEGANLLSASSSRLKKSTVIKTEIVKGTDDYYIYRSKSSASSAVLQDTMWVED
jgi:hypothetical protein